MQEWTGGKQRENDLSGVNILGKRGRRGREETRKIAYCEVYSDEKGLRRNIGGREDNCGQNAFSVDKRLADLGRE